MAKAATFSALQGAAKPEWLQAAVGILADAVLNESDEGYGDGLLTADRCAPFLKEHFSASVAGHWKPHVWNGVFKQIATFVLEHPQAKGSDTLKGTGFEGITAANMGVTAEQFAAFVDGAEESGEEEDEGGVGEEEAAASNPPAKKAEAKPKKVRHSAAQRTRPHAHTPTLTPPTHTPNIKAVKAPKAAKVVKAPKAAKAAPKVRPCSAAQRTRSP